MRRHFPTIAALAVLGALAAFALVPAIMKSGGGVLGMADTDMRMQFYAWRQFGFGEMAQGRFPLWNPHLFAGAPYFGGVQSALLYPLNAPFLFLSTTAAVNLSYLAHVWLLGTLMFLWGRVRGLGEAAALTGGIAAMFGGAFFPHVIAGHLPHINTMAWAPLVFCSIDGWLSRRRWEWVLAGAGAVAMQVYAGFPQFMFYTAVAACVYGAGRWVQAKGGARELIGLGAIYPIGAALGAVQLIAALIASAETVRGEAVPWDFAAAVSFPPENFVTLAAPLALGGPEAYWGRSYFWEASMFIGASGLALAAASLREWRKHWPLLVVIAATIVLALGRYTPAYRLFYEYVPGFGKFRGSAKFIFPASLMLAMLAAQGVQELLGKRRRPWNAWMIGVCIAVGLLMATGSYLLRVDLRDWVRFVTETGVSDESYAHTRSRLNPAFFHEARLATLKSLWMGGAFAGAMAVIGDPSRTLRAWKGWAMAALLAAEMTLFARATTTTFRWEESTLGQKQKALAGANPDERILNVVSDDAMLLGASDAWGYDAMIARRYAEFMSWTQGLDPARPTQNLQFDGLHPLMTLVRLRTAMLDLVTGAVQFQQAPAPPMPRLNLMTRWKLAEGPDGVFAAMGDPSFNPFETVILETAPGFPSQAPTAQGTARIVEEETDAMTIEAETSTPAVLLVTDAWTPGWRAVALEGSAQTDYEVVPGNWFLRAIPLTSGRHSIRLEYAPRGLAAGWWISGLALAGYAAAWGFAVPRGRLKPEDGQARMIGRQSEGATP